MPTTILSADSGVGGLSVVQEIRKLVPGQRHVYLCDNAFYPYGLRADDELLQHFLEVMSAAIDISAPQIVVVACNTISTICLPKLRAITKLPVVGVVPAIKPAATLSKKHVIGILATPATIDRPYTDKLINEFAANCRVLKVGSAELVDMAEAKLRGIAPDSARISRILEPFFDRPTAEQPDVIVLACTHFPLLSEELAATGPKETQWIDSGGAIARRVQELLSDVGQSSARHAKDFALVTGQVDDPLAEAMKNFGFRAVRPLPAKR